MAVARRLISVVKVDDYTPQAILCIACQGEVDLTTAHYGRITTGFRSTQHHDVLLNVTANGEVIKTPTVTEHYFPHKITGFACHGCFTHLYNQTWRDKNDHLRRAFEVVLQKVEQPLNDDHDASPITKGLYAPHVGKRKHGRKADYFETASSDRPSAVIEDIALPLNPKDDRKLQGFDRPIRDDIKLKPKRIVVKRGKWKESPTEYNYTPKPAK